MAEENQPPLKKAQFEENEKEPFIVAPEDVELFKEFLAKRKNIIQDSSLGGPIYPSDPPPIQGTSTEHILMPPTDGESINGTA